MELITKISDRIKTRKRWVKPVIFLTILALIVVLIVVRINGKKTEAVIQERTQTVEVTSVMSKPFGEVVSVAGTVVPFTESKLASKVMGKVSAVNVDVGQRVRQGETLLTIDGSDYIAALRQAETSLAMAQANSIQAQSGYDNAKVNYQRTEELFKQGAVSISQLETAGVQLAAAESGYKANLAQMGQFEAMLEKARSDYSNTQVKAPFSGVVAKRLVNVGEMVSPQAPVFIIIQDEPLLVRVSLPENLVNKVVPGQPVDVFVSTHKTYQGKVRTVAPQADSQTKAFAAEILLEGVSNEVRPGMVAELRIITKQVDNALVVPTDALLDEDGGSSLFVVDKGVARHRKVTTGLVGQGHTQVLTGLQPGEMVVVRGNHLLVDGMKVRVEGTRRDDSPVTGGESQ